MSDTPKSTRLFIGGPHDGEWIAMPMTSPVYFYPVKPQPRLQVVTPTARGAYFYNWSLGVMVLEGMAHAEAARRLRDFYKPTAPHVVPVIEKCGDTNQDGDCHLCRGGAICPRLKIHGHKAHLIVIDDPLAPKAPTDL